MPYTTVKNLRWANEDHSLLQCIVKFDAFDEEVEFAAALGDCTEHGPEIYSRCVAGEFGDIVEYVPPPQLEKIPADVNAGEPNVIG